MIIDALACRSVLVVLTFLLASALLSGVCLAEGKIARYDVDVLVAQKQGKLVEGVTRGHVMRADQSTEHGGDDQAATPLESYAFALGACAVSSLRFIAQLEKVEISNIQVRVTGALEFDLDKVLTLSEKTNFSDLTLHISFDSPLCCSKKAAFIKRVISICPVCANTTKETPIRIVLQ